MVTHVAGDHIHPILQIFLEDVFVNIPLNVGITSTRTYHPHTHTNDGVLHIGEGPLTGLDPPGSPARLTVLKDFFDVWRTTGTVGTPQNNPNAFFSSTRLMDRVADATHYVQMTVNGIVNTQFENYSPHDEDEVVLRYLRIINKAPVANAQSLSTPVNTSLLLTLTGQDGDPEVTQSLSFRVRSLPTRGALFDSQNNPVTVNTVLPAAGLRYQPTNGLSGPDGFTFDVQDNGGTADGGQNTSAIANVSIQVESPVNQAPTASAQSVAARAGVARRITLTGNDGDPGATQTLTFRVVSLPSSGTLLDSNGNPVVPNTDLPGPAVTYTANRNADGADSFTFRVRDNGGTANGGVDTSAPATVSINVVNSVDPNDMLGPKGIGKSNAVAPGEQLPFTVRFENMATATAPAQHIVVQTVLDSDLDPATFSFGDIGFASTRIDLPDSSSAWQSHVDYSDYLGEWQVSVQADFDPVSMTATWTLTTIDPATGGLPEDPMAGFLLPNDASRRGDGFLNFTVQARQDRPTGTRIDSSAVITFDANDAIRTNALWHTVDNQLRSVYSI